MIITWIVGVLLGVGGILCLIAGAGLLRFPDVYSRLHATGIADTLGVFCVIAGLIAWQIGADNGLLVQVMSGSWPQAGASALVVAKLLTIGGFMALTGPVASHSLARAAWLSGLVPYGATRAEEAPSAD